MEVDKGAKVLFNNTVDALSLAISLRMKGRGVFKLNAQAFRQVVPKFRDELRAAVRDNVVRSSVKAVNTAYKSISKFFSMERGNWNKVAHFC